MPRFKTGLALWMLMTIVGICNVVSWWRFACTHRARSKPGRPTVAPGMRIAEAASSQSGNLAAIEVPK